MPIERLAASKVADFFRPFYNGFIDNATIWFAYAGKRQNNLRGHTFSNLTKYATQRTPARRPFKQSSLRGGQNITETD
jgi:hypothetical protein